MRRLYYGNLTLVVSNDVADKLVTLSTELANAGEMASAPVAAVEGTAELMLGVGVMVAVLDAPPGEESAESLESWAYMRDMLEELQSREES